MRQTTLSVALEVQPESLNRLSRLIEDLRLEQETPYLGNEEKYLRLKTCVPVLHFMSISVFPSAEYDPIFVIEANFDGAPGVFWGQIEATPTLEPLLRAMLRCCKRPADDDGPLYDSVTAPGSRYPLAPYLEARALRPSVFHHGNRGLDRDRILQEGELFLETRTGLGQPDPKIPNPYRSMTAEQIHQNLRAALLPQFAWLDQPSPERITRRERTADLARLFSFLLVVLFCLSLPGLLFLALLRAVAPAWATWFMTLGLGPLSLFLVPVVAGLLLYRTRRARPGEAASTRTGGLTLGSLSRKNKLTSLANPLTLFVAVMLILALVVVAISLIATLAMSVAKVIPLVFFIRDFQTFGQVVQAFGQAFGQAWWPIVRIFTVGLYTAIVVSLPAIVVWLRRLERRDSSHDAPPVNERLLREMTDREDRIAQNHMGSIVLVKPGILRMALFRAGHRGLGLMLRVVATDGYLGSMRTVHFAHWAFVSNGSRLMFFSNFDHSWDSYLDDFIEKAHGGLTLAWGSGVGFPPTRFLVLDGASHGRKFKAWARHSMAVSRFWYSAYRDFTVDQIERHARIADGLRKAILTPEEAALWARDL